MDSIDDLLVARAASDRDRTALICEERAVTFGELDARADRAAALLQSLGAGPGERVAWLGRTHEAWFELLFACARVGACFTPLNLRLAGPELAQVLADSGARLLFATTDQIALFESAARAMSAPPRLIVVDREQPEDYPALRDDVQRRPTPGFHTDALQLYTSGTTGLPKGVRLTHDNLRYFVQGAKAFAGLDYGRESTVLIPMPLFHVGGAATSLLAVAGGSRLILMPSFDPAASLRLIGESGVTHTGFAPTMALMLLQSPAAAAADVSGVRVMVYGGAPMSEALQQRLRREFGWGLLQMYGMTESTATGSMLTSAEHVGAHALSCGRPWSGTEMRIVDSEGRPAPDGEIGQIQIRGPGVMAGYWNNEKATAEALTKDGWLNTGDAGQRGEDGYFFIHDRVKDMIITGAENVYPAEVENALAGCPGVAEVAVIGVPDERWGEAVKALVVLEPAADPNPAAIIAWARERIAGYKLPKTVDFVEALPKNPSGKILRRTLREPYWAGRARRVS